jgi:hypothetical protein
VFTGCSAAHVKYAELARAVSAVHQIDSHARHRAVQAKVPTRFLPSLQSSWPSI